MPLSFNPEELLVKLSNDEKLDQLRKEAVSHLDQLIELNTALIQRFCDILQKTPDDIVGVTELTVLVTNIFARDFVDSATFHAIKTISPNFQELIKEKNKEQNLNPTIPVNKVLH